MTLLQKIVFQFFSSRPCWRSFVYLVLCIFVAVFVGYALIFTVSYLPQDSLRQHLQKAYAEGYFADNYPAPPYPLVILNKKLDMYTECVGQGISVNMRPDLKSLLYMPTFGECSRLSQAILDNFDSDPMPYMRYIHGYQLFLKPLYTFFPIDTVRLVTCAITLGLMMLLFITLRNQLNTAYAAVIILSFFITKSSSVFFLVTHASQLWLVLIGATFVVRFHRHISPIVLFGVIGACDTFFSFLNMGSLSLSLPLLCYTLILWKNNKTADEIVAALLWGGIGWSIGFVMPWLLKWTILKLTFHPTRAMLFGVTLDKYPAQNVQMIFIALYKNIMGLQWAPGIGLCALMIIRKLWRRLEVPPGLWAVTLSALVPVVWVCILPGQSGIIHAFFINVILWPCVAAIFLLLLAMPKPQQSQKCL